MCCGGQGSLRDLLREARKDGADPETILPMVDRLMFVIQVAAGMAYLHERSITHEALATKRLLVDDGRMVKIGTLGRRGGHVRAAPERRRDSIASPHRQELDRELASVTYDIDVMQWMVRK